MTARTEVTDLLVTHLPPTALVVPYARDIDAPATPTVMLRLDKVTPSTDALGWLDYGYALVLVAAQTTTGPADDELEDFLLDVLYALDKAGTTAGITWREATRGVFPPDNPIHPAFEVPITVTVQRESA